jgi:hypothetical protein
MPGERRRHAGGVCSASATRVAATYATSYDAYAGTANDRRRVVRHADGVCSVTRVAATYATSYDAYAGTANDRRRVVRHADGVCSVTRGP